MYKAAAPINLGGPIKSYQSVGAGGWMVPFRLTFLRSSSADALVPARRWRVRWSGRDAERSREIGAGEKRIDETTRRIFEKERGKCRGRSEGKGEGATGERRGAKSFVARSCSIPSSRYPAMWYTCRESCCIVRFRTLKYVRDGKRERRGSANLRGDRSSIFPSARYSLAHCRVPFNRFSKNCGWLV